LSDYSAIQVFSASVLNLECLKILQLSNAHTYRRGIMTEKDKTTSEGRLSRRSFLKGVAATGAMATIAAAHPAAAAQPAGEQKTGTKSWRDKPDPIDESLISDGGTYDIVVVGGGNAGLICARAAAMKGASVAVIESQPEKSWVCVGTEVGTINSRYAMDHGAPKINEDDFLREWARRSIIRHNPKRAGYFAKNSGRILDWIIKDADKEWLKENSHVMSCPPLPMVLTEVSGWRFYHGSTIFRKMTDGTGTFRWPELMKVHYQKSVADGARWFFEHHAEICDVDGSGAVTGVVAKSPDGKYVRLKAGKGVALCAGDFSGNREMVVDILDELRHTAEAQGDVSLVKTSGTKPLARDGSSIKLGMWAGGHVEIGPRSCIGVGDPGTGEWYLQLDANGERFCDEAAGTTLSKSKDAVIVTVHDANWKKALEMMPPRHGAPDTAHTINWPARLSRLDNVKPGPPSKDKEDTKAQGGMPPGMMGTTYCSNTIEELLDYMDCYKGESRKKAMDSIKRYNELCEKGADEDFGKDPRILKVTAVKAPPFYGAVSKGGGMGAMFGISPGLCATTGLDTDADGRVLNSEFKPIKGLYAAGNNAGGRFIVVYQSPLAGISIGMAITDGCLLGERLADLKVQPV
jgi:fumarate reductase flavoprotein subunit